jgi:glycolate oxidase FAD binding subunit
MGGSAIEDADALWSSVRDHRHAFFAAAAAARAPLWRLSVGSTAPYTDLAGEQLIEWGGALRWLAATPATDAARLRAWAASHGGHATLFRATPRPAEAFHPLPPALAELHRRLKATFDPAGILNRHRLSSAF